MSVVGLSGTVLPDAERPGNAAAAEPRALPVAPDRRFLGSLAAQACSRALSMLTAMALFVLVARLSGPATLGQLSFALAFLGIVSAFADLGTGSVLARDLQAADPMRHDFLGSFVAIRLALAAAAIAFGFGMTLLVPADLAGLLRVCLVAAPFLGVRLFDTLFQISGTPWRSVAIAATKAAATVLLAPVVLWSGGGVAGCIGVYVGIELCCFAAGCALAKGFVPARLRASRAAMGAILRTARPIGLAGIFMLINNRVDVFLLDALLGPAELGTYTTAYRLLDIGTTAVNTFTMALLPVLAAQARRDPDTAQATYRALVAALVGVALPLVVLMPLVSPLLIGRLYGPAYVGAAPVLNILAWALVMTLFDSVTFTFLLSIDRIRHAYWNSMVSACVNVGLNLWLIPALGIVGAAWATLASVASLAIGQALIMRDAGLDVLDRKLLLLGGAGAALAAATAALVHAGAPSLIAAPVLAYALLCARFDLAPVATLYRRFVGTRPPAISGAAP